MSEPKYSKAFDQWMWTCLILWIISAFSVMIATESLAAFFATLAIEAFFFVTLVGLADDDVWKNR